MEKPSEIIKKFADLSYQSEKLIYSQATFKIETKNGFNDAKSLRDFLRSNINFNAFQEGLKNLIYGENYTFVKYFYERSFISQIAINTKRWEKKVLEGTAGKSASSGEYKEFQKSIKNVGHLDSENSDIQQLQKKLTKAGQDLWTFIEKLGIIDNAAIRAKLTGKDSKEFMEIIGNILSEYLLTASFTYGYVDKTGKKLQKKISDGTLIELLSKGLKGLSFYRAEKDGKLQVQYPNATFFELVETVNSRQGEVEFQVYADKNTITDVVTGAIGFLQDLPLLKDSDGNTIVSFTENSDNTFAMNFNANSELKNLDIQKLTPDQARESAIIVLDTIENILSRYNDTTAFVSFKQWRNSAIEEIFGNMLYEDNHLLEEILNRRTMAHVSGVIGEVMFSLFLKLLSQQRGIGKGVKVLGQTDFGTGSAAVDTKMITEENLRDIGFQIKNYSSIKNTIALYSQSNKLSAEKEMKRYIQDWAYKIIYDIFFTFNTDNNSVYPNKEYAQLIEKIGNLLEQHIPYYLRFDEASLEKQEQDLTQNNFYIINFSFIPASTIFIIISEALEENENNLKDTNTNFFFFSKNKTEGELFAQQNLLDSWVDTFNAIQQETSAEDNLISQFKKNIYVNFIGVRITFQKELEILFSKAK